MPLLQPSGHAQLKAVLAGGVDIAAPVPDLDRAASVLTAWDGALEIGVLQGMVLRRNGQTLVPRVRRHSLGDRPRPQHPVDLESEVVMVGRSHMVLDDEHGPFSRLAPAAAATRLLRTFEIPSPVVAGKLPALALVRHGFSAPASPGLHRPLVDPATRWPQAHTGPCGSKSPGRFGPNLVQHAKDLR